MAHAIGRREFLEAAIAGSALCAGCSGPSSWLRGPEQARSAAAIPDLVSPGCRGTKVRIACLYAVGSNKMWPHPKMDSRAEMATYQAELAKKRPELADVEFPVQLRVESVEETRQALKAAADCDGILLIHLSMGIQPVITEVLAAGKPTVLYAAPYSGHEWTSFGAIEKDKTGAMLICVLSADRSELIQAIRPIRAIHHLREAKIINVTTNARQDFAAAVKAKFGTQVKTIGREAVLAAYNAVPEADARREADRWISGARAVVEPTRDEIVRSCRLALAFQKILDGEKATVISTDCYGSMYHQLPAFPCIGNVRLNNLGLGGICESDLSSAMTHIILQGLSGRPGFISDPTMDTSKDSIILAHCLGSLKMDGPAGPSAPYKLRSIMERQEGAVPQVFMRKNQRVTQAMLIGADRMQYFTGTIIDAPDIERGCRTKITVKVDGDPEALWKNWSHGLHRVTCYGDLTTDLTRFCKMKSIAIVDEAAARV